MGGFRLREGIFLCFNCSTFAYIVVRFSHPTLIVIHFAVILISPDICNVTKQARKSCIMEMQAIHEL